MGGNRRLAGHQTARYAHEFPPVQDVPDPRRANWPALRSLAGGPIPPSTTDNAVHVTIGAPRPRPPLGIRDADGRIGYVLIQQPSLRGGATPDSKGHDAHHPHRAADGHGENIADP